MKGTEMIYDETEPDDDHRTLKVHRIELLIVDHDNVGAEKIRGILENQKYPNHCIAPHVMDVETREVDWTDDCELNMIDGMEVAYRELFGLPPEDLWKPNKGKK